MTHKPLAKTQSFYEIELTSIEGEQFYLERFKGKVLLIVNVASKCGFTPQYEGLEALYQKFRSQGFEILGFPCNQFGAQEPGNSDEIKQFCSLTYQVTFPLFSKAEVNGDNAHPLFKYLKSEAPGILGTEAIKWNFTKFLVSRNGEVIGRYSPATTPEGLGKYIEQAL